jgi:hypothetical protein
MNSNTFGSSEINLCDWQYTIRHSDTSSFVCGEKVFLKSNPELPMIIHSMEDNQVMTTWKDTSGNKRCHNFKPECVLQYKYAPLMTVRKIFSVCLN